MLLFFRRKHRPSGGELPNPHYHPVTGRIALGLEKSQKLLRASGALALTHSHLLLIYPREKKKHYTGGKCSTEGKRKYTRKGGLVEASCWQLPW